MDYELVRSKRKTLAISIDQHGKLTARAPLSMPRSQIEAFINQKHDWILKTQTRIATRTPTLPALSLQDGASFPYLGQTVTLQHASVSRIGLVGNQLLLPFAVQELSPVVQWIDQQARQDFALRVQHYSAQLHLYPKMLRLTRAKGRWGSMSSKGTLSLNRALILCPPAIIDYVVIHELCHIAHPNHSSVFWNAVARALPDYTLKRKWLKEHGFLISLLPR